MGDSGTGIGVINHLDDVACSHGANQAFRCLAEDGAISSASVMVPTGWFPEAARIAADLPDFDLGVHLVLTSESAGFRWRPMSTTSQSSGLIDVDGYFWARTGPLRSSADPDAVEGELRCQIEVARASGIPVTHLDHHMGAALAPEFIERTAAVASDYGLPMLLPVDYSKYAIDVELDEVDPELAASVRSTLGDLAVADRFSMGLSHQDQSPHDAFALMVDSLSPGVTFFSLHCSMDSDIAAVHPHSAAWRVAEHELFESGSVQALLQDRDAEILTMRDAMDWPAAGSHA